MATVTIKDVAREAGVSVASVSRALNGGGGVTAATSQRIHDVATRLSYVPHAGARSLITRRTHTIGALLPDLHGEFFSELIRGIDLAARARGLHLLVSSSHDGAEDAAHVDAAFLRANLPASVPAVLLNSAVKSKSYAVLNIDNYGGAYAMVRHLLEAGHSNVTFIAGPAGNFDAQQRELGYRAAMAKYAPHAPLDVVAGDFNEESGYRAGQQLLARKPRPDAVFAANDMMAVGCLYAFKEAGVDVPREIALAGFDDIPIARYVTPPLSTVRVRIVDLGRSALEQLAAMLEESRPDAASAHTLDCEIVTRETCGAARQPGAAKGKVFGSGNRSSGTGGKS